MPRFTLCAAIPLFDRDPINPAVPINRLRAPRVAAAPGRLQAGALPRALPWAVASPTASSRSFEWRFECRWSER